jgi:cbb3-type cytochrome oxidase maturation protein
MTGLFILIPVALFLGVLGLIGFLWSLKSGQFDDLDGAAERGLIDRNPDPPASTSRDRNRR